MSDISASERRLSAALDRIDQLLEAGSHRRPAAVAAPSADADLQGRLDQLEAENARLAAELAALRTDQGGPVEAALAEARTRLSGASDQAARLVAANDELAAANRALIEAADGASGDASIAALEAEVEALRAARAAEIAQMGDIMVELERLLASQDAVGGQDGPEDASVLSEVTGDSAGVPEDEPAEAGDAMRDGGK